MSNTDNSSQILRMLSERLGKSPDSIKSSAQRGNISDLISSLDKKQRDKISSILSNPEAMKKIMENPAVRSMIEKNNTDG